MILDVDIGNTRLKWRVIEGGVVAATGVTSHEDEWLESFSSDVGTPVRVRVSAVGGRAVAEVLHRFSLDRWGVVPEYAESKVFCAGVRNGYDQPERLGVDRWLAVVGAYSRYQGPLCVIDAGTAITVDFVGTDGGHRGGYIAPGLRLMAASLLKGTEAVRFDQEQANHATGLTPGRNTAEAVRGGITQAALGLLERVAREGESGQQVVMTGGDAAWLKACWGAQVVVIPDLVLEGLAVALP